MTSSIPRRLATGVAVFALAACHRGVTVGSPAPATPSAAPAPAVMAKASGLPADVTPAMIEEGKTLFAVPCARCHGATGGGAPNGPNLTAAKWVHSDGSFAGILKTIQTGVPKDQIKGPSEETKYPYAMRPMGGGTFTDAQIKSLAAYVYSITHK